MADTPHRRLRLQLTVEADNLDHLCRALDQISCDLDLDRQEERVVTSGGYHTGWHLPLLCNPDMDEDGDQYRADLADWLRHQKQEARHG